VKDEWHFDKILPSETCRETVTAFTLKSGYKT
jgi:hypothetical protein